MYELPRYRGKFGVHEAERLLWRAGFGPKPGQARKLAQRSLKRAVQSLTRPTGQPKLRGPEPSDEFGLPLAPNDAHGHDVLWWLDRMVRTTHPLQERMALNFHDWFATGEVNYQHYSIAQTDIFRKHGLGSFHDMLRAVTADPAMLIWLSGFVNEKGRPNENYARELMELFTLGASNEAGYPYSETDVREQARALTGWRASAIPNVGLTNFRFDPTRHDHGPKTIFGQTGPFHWLDSCRLCVEHRAHPAFFVTKLWNYFIPIPPTRRERKALQRLYVKARYRIRPVVEAILMHPKFYNGPAMVKPPVVYVAGLHRARGVAVQGAWAYYLKVAGQLLFYPPNVAGWDERRWLDTSTFRGRWIAANVVAARNIVDPGRPFTEGPEEAVRNALRFWGNPLVSDGTREELLRFAHKVEGMISDADQTKPYRANRQNALRMLIATSPDMQAA